MMIKLNGDFSKLREDLKYSLEHNEETEIMHLFFDYEEGKDFPPFSVELITSYIQEIKKMYPNQKFDYDFSYILENNYVVDSNYCKTLESIDNYLRENFDKELKIATKEKAFTRYGFRKTLSANRKLDSVAEKIKNATNNGEPLSTFEKFMVAYEYVTEFAYNEGGDIMHTETSYWVPVLEGDKIVCAGYSSLLKALCDRIFDSREAKVLYQSLEVYDKQNNNEYLAGHANNIIFIKDEKYGLNGLFYVDACWDSISESRKDKPQAYCCIPIHDILHCKNYSYKFSPGFTDFYLLQDKTYIEFVLDIEREKRQQEGPFSALGNEIKEKNFEDKVEEFFQGYKKDDEAQKYFAQELSEITYYDTISWLSADETSMLTRLREDTFELVLKKYKKIFDKYKDVYVPGFIVQDLIDFYNIGQDLEVLKNEFEDEEKVEKAIDNLAKVFSDSRAIEYRKRVEETDCASQSLGYYIAMNISSSVYQKKSKEFQQKRDEYVKKSKRENAVKLINNLNEKADSGIVPVEAFINAYRIIGKQKDLKGEELEAYVKNRIIKSIERTQLAFETDECRGCFSTTRIEDFIRCVTKK